MNARTDQLLTELLALPTDGRTKLVNALLESLEADDVTAISGAWRGEIRRRKAEIVNTTAKFSSWSEAKSRFLSMQ